MTDKEKKDLLPFRLFSAADKTANRRMLIIFVIAFFAVYLAVSTVLAVYEDNLQEVTRQENHNYLKEISKQTVENIGVILNQNETIVRELGQNVIDKEYKTFEEAFAYLEGHQANFGFSTAHFIAEDGIWYSKGETKIYSMLIPYVSKAFADEKAIMSEVSDMDGTQKLAMIVPLDSFEIEGVALRAIAMTVTLENAGKILKLPFFESKGSASIITASGDLIYSSYQDAQGQMNDGHGLLQNAMLNGITIRELLQSMQNEESGTFRYVIDGRENIASYAPIDWADWYLFVVIPMDAFTQRDVDIMHILRDASITLGIILVCMSLAMMVSLVVFQAQKRKALEDDANSLRLREELYRLAITHSTKHVMRFDVKSRTLWVEDNAFYGVRPGTIIEDMPESILGGTVISTESKADIRLLFDGILAGENTGACVATVMNSIGEYAPHQINYTVIFDEENNPAYAIITFENIAVTTERELVYKRWRQTLETLPKKRYRIIEHNLSKDTVDNAEGGLFDAGYIRGIMSYDERMTSFVEDCVFPEDAPLFKNLMTREALLKDFYEGKRFLQMEFRLCDNSLEPHWVKLSMQLIEYPNSTEIKVYKMYEDIDAAKKKELALRLGSQQDSLTKVLNRRSFEETAMEVLNGSKEDAQHALMLLDIDHLKEINDRFGHAVGDKILITLANNLRAVFDEKDIIGRLGGDEFFILMRDVSGESNVARRAKQVNAALRKAGDTKLNLSCSIGIAMYPRDGKAFDDLYKSADKALYRIKDKGRDDYGFFSFEGNIQDVEDDLSPENEVTSSLHSLFKSKEDLRNRSILEIAKTAIIEVDVENHRFFYDARISSYLAGKFDDRSLWNILLLDEVADLQTVRAMQAFTKKLVKEKPRDTASMEVSLKKATGEKANFRMGVLKVRDEQGSTIKVLITFNEIQPV